MNHTFEFTDKGFVLVITQEEYDSLEETQKHQADRICQDPWNFMLDLGLHKNTDSEQNAVCAFLQECASQFLDDLLRQPGLEELRQDMEMEPEDVRIRQLLKSVPFVKTPSCFLNCGRSTRHS